MPSRSQTTPAASSRMTGRMMKADSEDLDSNRGRAQVSRATSQSARTFSAKDMDMLDSDDVPKRSVSAILTHQPDVPATKLTPIAGSSASMGSDESVGSLGNKVGSTSMKVESLDEGDADSKSGSGYRCGSGRGCGPGSGCEVWILICI